MGGCQPSVLVRGGRGEGEGRGGERGRYQPSVLERGREGGREPIFRYYWGGEGREGRGEERGRYQPSVLERGREGGREGGREPIFRYYWGGEGEVRGGEGREGDFTVLFFAAGIPDLYSHHAPVVSICSISLTPDSTSSDVPHSSSSSSSSSSIRSAQEDLTGLSFQLASLDK